MIAASSPKIAAIIPARMASTRFPGKPLLKVCDLPMIEHVRRRTLLCKGFSEVIVATCDPEIVDVVESFGGKCIMTSDQHKVATERIVEAMQKLDCTHVVNVQGDEILILPQDLETMLATILENPQGPLWNAYASLQNLGELWETSIVKCILNKHEQFMFCARNFSNLPLPKDGSLPPAQMVLGILGYTRSFLEKFSLLEQTPLEILESIEQFRFLEYGFPVRGVKFTKNYPGINTPAEAKLVQEILAIDKIQQSILEKIL